MDVAVITSSRLPFPDPDEACLHAAFGRNGLHSQTVAWDDPSLEWASIPFCLIRSTWDYHLHHHAFLAWARQVTTVSSLWNPLPLLQWNSHKSYLRLLAARGIPTIPTIWLPAGSTPRLADLLDRQQWERAVVKPMVSASAHHTFLVMSPTLAETEERFHTLCTTEDVMVQPYLASVETIGERSLIFIDGQFSHAVRKCPVLVEGEVLETTPVVATPSEIALGHAVLDTVNETPLYARIDLVRDADDALRLMELELIEPCLFLHHAPGAAHHLAEATSRLLRKHRPLAVRKRIHAWPDTAPVLQGPSETAVVAAPPCPSPGRWRTGSAT